MCICHFGGSGPKWSIMVRNGRLWSIIVRNDLLWHETGYYGPKRDIMVRKGILWYEMGYYGTKGYFMGIFYLETAQRSAGVVASQV